jgi:hypothetical protein
VIRFHLLLARSGLVQDVTEAEKDECALLLEEMKQVRSMTKRAELRHAVRYLEHRLIA